MYLFCSLSEKSRIFEFSQYFFYFPKKNGVNQVSITFGHEIFKKIVYDTFEVDSVDMFFEDFKNVQKIMAKIWCFGSDH